MTGADAWNRQQYWDLLVLRARRVLADDRLKARFDPEDLVSETLLRAVRAEHGASPFRGSSDGERVAYLNNILDNLLVDWYRRHLDAQGRSVNREQSLRVFSQALTDSLDGAAALPAGGLTPSSEAAQNEHLDWLRSAIPTLPDRERAVMVMRVVEGCPLADIAAALGETENAVGGLIFRATKRLRDQRPGPASSEEPL